MSSELHGLLDNEDGDEDEGPFTKRPKSTRKEKPEDPLESQEGNIITRNKKTSLLLAISIGLVLVICGIVVFLIIRNTNDEQNVICQPMNFTDNVSKNASRGKGVQTCHPVNFTNPDNTIVAPQNDHNSYKVLVLSNHLRVVLISDSNATQAAAAVDVNAGSFNDPPGIDGMAHFCEHMLFLGTKKYPGKNEYSNFLSTNGGYDNAYTSIEHTNYYFAVNLDVLEEALDRFAQFFIAPLFLETETFSEMTIINSEYDKDLNNPNWKFYQLLKHVSNPEHPFSRFTVGNIETLNISGIRQDLIKYYNTSYSANQMQLAVIGNNPLPTLENWVKNKFSSIPNRQLDPLRFNSTAYPPEYAGKLVYYDPGEPKHSVSIIWQLQSFEDKSRNQVSSLISRYLGDEGHGSILEYLKMKLWASSLSASTEDETASFTLYGVDIVLTDEGLVHVKDVVATVFQYIRILRAVSDDQWCHMWNEHINVSNIQFNNQDKSKPYDFVSDLASSMRTIKYPADFLSPPSRAVFDIDLINSALDKLMPYNSVVFVGSPDFVDKDTPTSPEGLPPPNLDSVEPWFNTRFTKVDTPCEVLNGWHVDDSATKLSLPPENNFIPKSLEIHPLDKNHSKKPTLVNSDNGLSVWWLQDDQFFSPKINLVCSMETPVAYSSSKNYTLTNIFLNYVAQSLKADLYPASLTGYSKSLDYNPNGLVITVNGYSDEDVMERYLNVLLQGIANATTRVNEDVYTVTLKSLKSYYENYNYNQLPYRYVRSYTQNVVLQKPYFKHSTILSELDKITSDQMLQHAKNLFKSFNTTCLIHGNVLKEKAYSYARQVKQMLSQPTTTVQQPFCSKQIVKADNGLSSVAIKPLNPTDKNSLVNVIFQIGRSCILQNNKCSNSSLRNYALSGLLQLIMRDQCFTFLRTEKQLGYVATCYASAHSDVLSFELLVQSGTYDPDHILSVMDEFLTTFYDDKLTNLTSEKAFNDTKSSYIEVINQKQLTLSDKTSFLWNYIAMKSYQFDIHSQVTQVVRSITGEELRRFYNDNLLQTSYRKLVISIFGYPSTPHYIVNSNTTVDYSKIDDFKSSASFFEALNC